MKTPDKIRLHYMMNRGTRGVAVSWDNALQAGKVAGSIPDGLVDIFQRLNASGRTMTLGSTQRLTDMGTRGYLLRKGGG
jgi:hypothetical protein